MQQIAGWLEKLGLSEYASRFAENDIDFSLLPELTDQDLEKIGVASLGHRRKILKAIGTLSSGQVVEVPAAFAPKPAVPAPPVAVAPPMAHETGGERRYLTVMFCDLVGSTAISAQLDAEEWRDLVGAYLDAASAAVAEMGGLVAKKLGDGLMSLFGYPVAHENDAERAVRAALAIQRALAELNRKNAGSGKPELAARIGLETGPAVLDSAGEVYGDVANVAARVQALAEPGAVLVTTRVQRQVVGLFVAEDRGTHALKGVAEPTALFRLIRASGGGRRLAQRHLTPLAGREEELAMLMRRWERARQGDGQLVMIVGEPGLGKSRLIEEFHTRLRDTPHTWVEWSCSQLLQNTPLHPIAEWGSQRFGGADVPTERRLAELESSLAQVKLDPAENIPLLAPLLEIPLPKERATNMASEELRRRQLVALINWVMAGARSQSVVLALEDLHWADPTTLDVLRGMAERGALAPLFVLTTTRPEFRAPWGVRSHHTTISLTPLDRQQVLHMVGELAARHALAPQMVEDVWTRTGGVPLFVEEVTRLLLDRGEQGGIQAIPPTLQQSLMARLDRLGPAREVAQIGAVLGRGFSYALLGAIAGMEDAPLQAALERLGESDLILVQGLPPDSDYRFKHALIQDAAYENLLKSRRSVLHQRVAETLRDKFPAAAAAEPEILAHHFTKAGLAHQAIEWWGKAGERAMHRSAYAEAIAHFDKSLGLAEALPDDRALRLTRIRQQIAKGNALIAVRGYHARETTAPFARARELITGMDDVPERFSAYYGLWVGGWTRAELAQAAEVAKAFLHDAERQPGSPEAGIAHRSCGMSCWTRGDFVAARAHLEQALAIYDGERDRELVYRFGQDYGISSISHLAVVLWPLGETERARRLADESIDRAMQSRHMPTMTIVHHYNFVLETIRGNGAAAISHIEANLRIGAPWVLQTYKHLLAWARWRAGDREAGDQAGMRRYLAWQREHEYLIWRPLYLKTVADDDGAAGRFEAALAGVEEALAVAGETGEHWFDAELNRARGEHLLRRCASDTAAAEAAFTHAVAIARSQQTRSFELRAALALAKLYRSNGRAAEVRAVLAPALAGFAPTAEFPEVAEAQTLLAALKV